MESGAACLGAALAEFSKHLCSPFFSHAKEFLKFGSNVTTLEKEMAILLDTKKGIDEEIERAKKDGNIPTLQTSTWLRKAEQIEGDVTPIQAEVSANKEKLHGCGLSCRLRYRLGTQVVTNLNKVKNFLKEGIPDELVMVDSRVVAVERLPGPSVMDQQTASRKVAFIIELLQNDAVGTIGIWGMGGIGKTTLITNLNNTLESMDKDSAQPFGIVIWVTVSKGFRLEKIQDRIAERLKMVWGRETEEGKTNRLLNRLRREEKFVVILDDVWDQIDINKIGIPQPKLHRGCKILVTTRFRDVCREMATDEDVRVDPLCSGESWELFSKTSGNVVNLKHVKPLAKELTTECAGLPLAIITVGSAMKGKEKVELWKHAVSALKSSNTAPSIRGIEKKLFLPLKLSFDSLDDSIIKNCFLYCCLYPEDFQIEINELLQCWAAEGLIDDQRSHEEAYNVGIALIENLKDSCMLECGHREGTLRMHDVIRDVAVWISSSSEYQHLSWIQSGFGLREIPEVGKWGSYRRVSFVVNEIEELPDSVPQCSQVTALFLQYNAPLKCVPSGFLRGFQALRVLNLSNTSIESLPILENSGELRVLNLSNTSIKSPPILENSGELRALLLRNCLNLKEFPPLKGLSKLQVLDLSGNRFGMSPNEEVLNLKIVSFLRHLLDFYIEIDHIPSESAWLRRLRKFKICIGGSTSDTYPIPQNERAIYLYGQMSLNRETGALWSSASALVLVNCQHIIEMWESAIVAGLDRLKYLTVNNCSWTGSVMRINNQPQQTILPSLEVISLSRITNLCNISDLIINSGGNIRIIEIKNCHHLTKLFPLASLSKLESLEEIHVNSCDSLEGIISDSGVSKDVLPSVRIMTLEKLPNIKNVCEDVLSWSCIKRIEVRNCPLLKKLPLCSEHVNTIEVIKGEQDWWDQLEWEDEATESSLQTKLVV